MSARAQRVRLTVSARDGLVVVVPCGWRGDPASVVRSHEAWVRRALQRIAARRELHLGGPAALLPDTVELRCTGETLAVRLCAPGTGPARVTRVGNVLSVSGYGDAAVRLEALSRWLDRIAREILPGRAAILAARHSLEPSSIRVTRARSRWGSCSSEGTVSLSRSLVFLPAHLVDALIAHELAHLLVMDHSARFWRELERFDPDARRHRAEIRAARDFVPAWAE